MKYACFCCLLLLASCATTEEKQERLARQQCGSCHLFTEPSLLDKETWDKHVLPQMAFRMSLDMTPLMNMSEDDAPLVIRTLPQSPMVTHEQFESIRQYFLREAPDSLDQGTAFTTESLMQFEATPIRLPGFDGTPVISMVSVDTLSKKIWISTRQSDLLSYSYEWKKQDSIRLMSPVSAILLRGDGSTLVSAMGIMDPNDQPKGQILRYSGTGNVEHIADSLKLPVHFEEVDFNGDDRKDLVICEFGNYGGELVVMENLGSTYARHILSYLPGARRVIVQDFNSDDYPDILALFSQGDEQISLLTNAGNFSFRVTTLLRFSPVMGSSYFDIADFNHDGNWDILYTNGDNSDYSNILKPYHGVHIYHNDGNNQFKESWFHAMPGASKALARDFDGDGDLDIAAISFFPDFDKAPERGFVYFRNDRQVFTPHTTPLGAMGRWLVMDAVDIDGDNDEDLLLGALNFNDAIPRSLSQMWASKPTDILVLKNSQMK